MNIKQEARMLVNEMYLDVDIIVDQVSLEWVLKNSKELIQKFKKQFKRSPYNYVVKIPTKKGFILFTENRIFKTMKTGGSHLKWTVLKKMGCPHSLKNRFVK